MLRRFKQFLEMAISGGRLGDSESVDQLVKSFTSVSLPQMKPGESMKAEV